MASAPEALVARFRVLGLERVQRIDASWQTAANDFASRPEPYVAMLRELHTLKGEATLLGFGEVSPLCQKLEDLFSALQWRQERPGEEMDVLVTLALNLLELLLRRSSDAPLRGIDVAGFVREVDEALLELAAAPSFPTLGGAPRKRAATSGGALGLNGTARERIGLVAAKIFLEHLRATGEARERLGAVFEDLAAELAPLEAAALVPVLQQHVASARSLASDLGKRVRIDLVAAPERVSAEVLNAVSTGVLHALRNAVDHGIEPPEKRGEKSPEGSVTVRVRRVDSTLEVLVEDDGAGVDLARVRELAIGRGLATDTTSDDDLLAILFLPAFSTRAVATEISGRGVGLDAARQSLDEIGGTVQITNDPGKGLGFLLRVPSKRSATLVRVVDLPGVDAPVALPGSWNVADAPGSIEGDILDLGDLLGLTTATGNPPPQVRLVRGERKVRVVAVGNRVGSAIRICPTPSDADIEVVELDGRPALLYRLR